MNEPHTGTETDLLATLNDLLELDQDAVGAYTIAIEALDRPDLKTDLVRFRGDHERHITDLTALVRAHGGNPAEHPHIPTGAFKSAVQAASAAGSDREVLLAFKSNEGQVRNKYRRMSELDHPADVADVLRRNAEDEERHYQWAVERLEAMGAGSDTTIGRAEAAFESVHGGSATAMEGAERVARRSPYAAGLFAAAAVGAATMLVRKVLK